MEAAIIWDERSTTRKGTEGCCEQSTNCKQSQNKPQRYEENPPSLPQTAQGNLTQEGQRNWGHTSTSDRQHLLLPITARSQQAAAGLISQLVFFFFSFLYIFRLTLKDLRTFQVTK